MSWVLPEVLETISPRQVPEPMKVDRLVNPDLHLSAQLLRQRDPHPPKEPKSGELHSEQVLLRFEKATV